jgi:membrane protease YdiL (CAAX protease family)
MSQPAARPLVHPHPEPRSYPLVLRTWTYAAWRPIVGILTVLVLWVAVQVALVPVLVLLLGPSGNTADAVQSALTEHVTWQGMLYLNVSLASLVPITWFVVRVLHNMRPRWLASVRPGFRWRFFAACFGVALVAIGAQLVVGAFLPGDPDGLGSEPNEITRKLVGLAIVIVLTTPLQAIGEEYGFRGYAMQVFGSLSRRPWVAVVVTSVLFALAHGAQNAPLFLDRLAFGLMAGYIVVKTGGLEAGIALHVWNNLVAFGFALFLGNIDDSLNISEISWWNIPLTITQNGVYLVLVLLVARRMGVTNRTSPPVLVPPTAAV